MVVFVIYLAVKNTPKKNQINTGMKYLAASAATLSFIQLFSVIVSAWAFYHYDVSFIEIILIVIGYFLYSGIGISMMMHRYWTHKSFEFKNPILERIFTWIAVLSGRGSPIGWVYVHRLHHAFSDTPKDPHDPETVNWKIFLPHLAHYGESIDKKIIRDLFNKEHLAINKYYMVYIILWSLFLLIISPKLFVFFYAIPVMLTFVGLDLFVALTHRYGYRNFETNDNSKNNWFISLILWGEGWHNNHHKYPQKYYTQEKFWEIDILGLIISWIKK